MSWELVGIVGFGGGLVGMSECKDVWTLVDEMEFVGLEN